MTKINNISLVDVQVFRRSDFDVTVQGWTNSESIFKQLKEMFAFSSTSVSVRMVAGNRPEAIDHTEDSILTVYCEFSSQTIMKPTNGWYVLRSFSYGAQNRTPRWIFSMELVFVGTTTYYQKAIYASDLEEVDNEWDL